MNKAETFTIAYYRLIRRMNESVSTVGIANTIIIVITFGGSHFIIAGYMFVCKYNMSSLLDWYCHYTSFLLEILLLYLIYHKNLKCQCK